MFPLPAVSVFWHPNLWALDNELRMTMGPLSGGPTNEIICRFRASQLWSVGSLYRLGRGIWGPAFVAAWWFASMALFWPTGLETVGSERCCVLWLSTSSGPVMQWLIGQVLFDSDASKIKSPHNICLCVKAVVRPAQFNLKYWTGSQALCSNHEQNKQGWFTWI